MIKFTLPVFFSLILFYSAALSSEGGTGLQQLPLDAHLSNPYLTDVSELLVTHKDSAPIYSLEDLTGKAFFVRKNKGYQLSERREDCLGCEEKHTRTRKKPQ